MGEMLSLHRARGPDDVDAAGVFLAIGRQERSPGDELGRKAIHVIPVKRRTPIQFLSGARGIPAEHQVIGWLVIGWMSVFQNHLNLAIQQSSDWAAWAIVLEHGRRTGGELNSDLGRGDEGLIGIHLSQRSVDISTAPVFHVLPFLDSNDIGYLY